MPRPIQAIISTSAMSHNVTQVRARLAAAQQALNPSTPTSTPSSTPIKPPQICAVIKANAYGHGTLAGVRGFAQADALGMIDVEDLVVCREAGWSKPLLLLEGFFEPSDVPVLQAHRVTTAVHSDEQIAMLASAPALASASAGASVSASAGASVSASASAPIDVFLKINTGMNRLGFTPDQALGALTKLQALQAEGKVGRIGHMMHFANADVDAQDVHAAYTLIQQVRGAYKGPLSICNSAASLRYPQFAWTAEENWVRPGICLYGSLPFTHQLADYESVDFKPSMTLRAEIIAVQTVAAGASVGYGSMFTAERETRIGVVACGYADGYPRSAPNGTPVTIDGHDSQLLGRVSMDMLTVDLSHLPQAGVGSQVILWGEGGPSIDTVAEHSGRIGYELMCGLTKRVKQLIS